MLLVLSEREAETLTDVLQRAICDVQAEVYWTELSEVHSQLQAREVVLRNVLDGINAARARADVC